MLTQVKVCGIRLLEDARLAAELGASAIGFIFWPRSPRYIDPELASIIAAALPQEVMVTGVFVDQEPAAVAAVARAVRLDAIQLHGTEDVAAYAGMPQRLIKAVAVGDGFEPGAIDALPESVTVLLDAHDPVRRGGTGRTIDWSAAAAIAARRETILSGGLNPLNVAEAIARVRPRMIDVSSGVESAPGRKDPATLRALFAAIETVSAK